MHPALRPRISANLSMLFTEVPLLDRFARARRAGFEVVELQFPYEVPIDELARASREAGTPVVLFNVPAGSLLAGGDGLACVPGKEAAFREALELARDYAAVLAPRVLNVLPGRLPEGVIREDAEATFLTNLRVAVAALADEPTTIVVEALNRGDIPRFLVEDHDELVELVERSGTGARIQYDVYHQARIGRDVVRDLRAAGAELGHVQIADLPRRSAPGTGSVDFGLVFEALVASGYRGFVGAEYRPEGATEATLAWLDASR